MPEILGKEDPDMAVRKRNEFLEDGSSGDDEVDGGYISEEEDGRGGIGGRVNKRRKVDDEDDGSDNESFHSFVEEEEKDDATATKHLNAQTNAVAIWGEDRFALGADFEDDDGDNTTTLDANSASNTKKPRPKAVAAAEKAARRSGVVYISRVPPFMKPATLKHFLAPHASKGLGRIFLTPEDHTSHVARVKRGGNKKKSFTDGWVEFTSKTEAKDAAERLNGGIMGGKKGGFYYDDMWNVKYLKGFKWSHLTEQIANENADRAARLREELRRTKQENKAFVQDVERGKALVGMESKRAAKRKAGSEGDAVEAADESKRRKGREFKQRKARDRDVGDERSGGTAEQRRVLSMIL